MVILRKKPFYTSSYGGITRIRYKGRRLSLPLSLLTQAPLWTQYSTNVNICQVIFIIAGDFDGRYSFTTELNQMEEYRNAMVPYLTRKKEQFAQHFVQCSGKSGD